jgi:NAD-dependent oxidoreductase involved in siderophore biosynthesis
MTAAGASMTRVSPASARQSSGKVGQPSGKAGQLAQHQPPAAIAGRLRLYLTARHPVKTAAAVAAATGLNESGIAKWLDARSAPSSPALLVLVGTYGPSVLAAAMAHPPKWLDDATAQQRRAEIEAELEALNKALRGIA